MLKAVNHCAERLIIGYQGVIRLIVDESLEPPGTATAAGA